VWSTETRTVISRHTVPEGSISGLTWSPKSNLLAFTSLDGSFHRWVDPVPSELPSPVTTEAQAAKRLDKLLDDEFDAEEDEDIEEKGEDLEGQYGDDWIVDDDGQYAADDDEQKWSKGRTEVGELTTISSDPHEWRH
jgi:chromosome transmission fidelity protein 4